jgi:GntR family transcriptional regulator, transcriptional repressor for pyruvate dehydrogenase complex
VIPTHQVDVHELFAHKTAEHIRPKELWALEQIEASHRAGALEFDLKRFRERDIGFHQGIADASKNPFFSSAVATTLKLNNWAVDVSLARTPGSLLIAADEHALILEAIREGNAPAARQAMKAHLESAFNNYLLEVRRRLSNDL